MEKKYILIAILILIFLIAFAIYQISLYDKKEGEIIEITDSGYIIMKTPYYIATFDENSYNSLMNSGISFATNYSLFGKDTSIKNVDGTEIELSDLQVGDTICVIYKKWKDTESNQIPSENIKFIQKLDKKLHFMENE